MGYDEINMLGLHEDKVLFKDSKDYIIASQEGREWHRTDSYADIREYCMNRLYKGFSPYFNKEDIHHVEELV